MAIRQYQTDDGYHNDAGLGTEFQLDAGFFNSGGLEARTHDAVGEFINVLESVTVAIASGLNVSVSDAVGETDATIVQIPMRAVVSDDDPASESVALELNPLLVVVNDDDSAVEAVVLALVADLVVAVSDDAPAAEAVTVQIPLAVVVADDTPSTEFVNAAPSLGISVFDDNTFPPLEPPPMPATGIARDYVEVLEGLGMGLGLPVLAGDDITTSEEALIGLAIPVRVWDGVPVVDVIDTDAVTINPVLVGFNGVVVDALTPTEAVTVVLTAIVLAADALTPTDVAQVSLPLKVEAADDVPPTDVPQVRMPVGVLVADAQPLSEAVDAFLSVLLVEAVDDQAVGELVGGGIPMNVLAFDETAIGERRNIRAFLDDLHFINDAGVEVTEVAGAVTRRI